MQKYTFFTYKTRKESKDCTETEDFNILLLIRSLMPVSFVARNCQNGYKYRGEKTLTVSEFGQNALLFGAST